MSHKSNLKLLATAWILAVFSFSIMASSTSKAEVSLHEACVKGDLAEVKRQAKTPEDANRVSLITTTLEDGTTQVRTVSPLGAAAANARPEVVAYLLSLGAKVEGFGAEEIPLIAACQISPKNLNSEEREDDLNQTVIQLLNAKASLNAEGWFGRTALHWASYYSRDTLINILRSSELKLNLEDAAGKTALDLAASKDHIKTVGHLLGLGAKQGKGLKKKNPASCELKSKTAQTLEEAFDTNLFHLLKRMSPFNNKTAQTKGSPQYPLRSNL